MLIVSLSVDSLFYLSRNIAETTFECYHYDTPPPAWTPTREDNREDNNVSTKNNPLDYSSI